MEDSIHFFAESIVFQLEDTISTKNWLHEIINKYEVDVSNINFIFCSDEYLLNLNRSYLDHDYYTDILTFPYHPTPESPIESDIYISIDRVKDNADTFEKPFLDELHRVIVHGLLHLIGFDDHSESDKEAMTQAENEALALRK